MNYNKLSIAGHMCQDPELKVVGAKDTSVCNFSVAVNGKFKKGDEWMERTDFIDVVAWGKTAEIICEHFTKGKNIFLDGRFQQETWETDGSKRSKIVMVADTFYFVGPKAGGKDDVPF